MTYVAYVTPEGRAVVENVEPKEEVFSIRVGEFSSLCAAAIDEKAEYFAISRLYDEENIVDGCLELYHIRVFGRTPTRG